MQLRRIAWLHLPVLVALAEVSGGCTASGGFTVSIGGGGSATPQDGGADDAKPQDASTDAVIADNTSPSRVDGAELDVGSTDVSSAPTDAAVPSDTSDRSAQDAVADAETAITNDAGCRSTAPSCDDGNGCTEDKLDEHCVCTHTAVAEGTSCDDGDICTDADRCKAGACVGERWGSSPRVLGTIHNYGGALNLSSLVTFVSADRAVFASGRMLTLVEIRDDRMTILDRRKMEGQVTAGSVSAYVWALRPETFLLPLPNRRLAIVSSRSGIEYYDLSQDRFTLLERYGVGSYDDLHTGAASDGTRIWTCANAQIRTYTLVSAPPAILSKGAVPLPAQHLCRGLALSTDGKTLLAATSRGLDVLSVSDPTAAPSVLQTVKSDAYLLDVATNADYVGVYQLNDPVSAQGDVILLRAGTYDEVAAFPGGTAEPTPIGFTLLDDGLLLQRRKSEPCSLLAELYRLEPTGPLLRSTWAMQNSCQSPPPVPTHTVGAGHLAALEPAHQIVRVDSATGSLIPIMGREQGSFEVVRPNGPTTVEVHGGASMHLVDIADPAAPVVKEGGLMVPMNAEALRLELGGEGPTLLTVPSLSALNQGPTTTLYWSKPGTLPAVAGSIANEDETSTWVVASDDLYQLASQNAPSVRLRRFPSSTIQQTTAQSINPDREQTLLLPTSLGWDKFGSTRLLVEATSGDLVIRQESSSTQSDVTGSRTFLHRYAWSLGGYQRVSTIETEGTPVGVAVSGGRAAIAYADRVSIVDSAGTQIAVARLDPAKISIHQLLSWRGGQLYFGVTYPGQAAPLGVLVLRDGDLSELTRYATEEYVTSIAEAGRTLVFGMAGALSTASPACAASGSDE